MTDRQREAEDAVNTILAVAAECGRLREQLDAEKREHDDTAVWLSEANALLGKATEQLDVARQAQRERDHLAMTLANVQASGGVPSYVHRNIEAALADTEAHFHEVDELEDRVSALTGALKAVLSVLGPEPADCGCDGCAAEISEALRIARAALTETEQREPLEQAAQS